MSSTVSARLSSLPVDRRHTIGPEHLDGNGHMNIIHYFRFATEAMLHRQNRDLLTGEDYISTRGMTAFTAEQHSPFRRWIR